MNRSTEKMQMSKQKSDEPAGFRVHPNGEIELLSARETWDIVVRTTNAAVARGLGGRRNTEFANTPEQMCAETRS
jgi:hypothetical protein